MHDQPHPLAGQTVSTSSYGEFVVEDWWDRVTGGSWMYANGNIAAMKYGVRSGKAHLPIDDEVVYGKVNGNGFGNLVHVSEIAVLAPESTETSESDVVGTVAPGSLQSVYEGHLDDVSFHRPT